MPKAEIHVHLEGATAAATYFEIAKRNGIELATESLPQWNEYFKFRDFNHFIEVYVGCTKFLRTADDYALLVKRFGEQQAALNIKYTETFVSCSLLPEHIDRSAFLDAIHGAAERDQAEQVAVRFIADISRDPDLAGQGPRTRDRRPQARRLHRRRPRRRRSVPAGAVRADVSGRASGRSACRRSRGRDGRHRQHDRRARRWRRRIGHGVMSLEDPDLMARLRQTQIPLEICPQSNYHIGVSTAGQPHQIRALKDAGVYVTVNSDDPAMFETDLSNEYRTLASQNFSWDELWALNRATLNATFASDADKRALNEEWDRFAEEATV